MEAMICFAKCKRYELNELKFVFIQLLANLNYKLMVKDN